MLTPAATTRLHHQLRELPEILTHAYLALLPSGTTRTSRVSGATRTPPLPCNLDTLTNLAPSPADGLPEITILESWARTVLDDRAAANDWTAWIQLPAIHGEIPASTSIKILAFHLPFAVTRAYAGDLATEIADLHHHLNAVARHPIRSARPIRTACPACHLLALCERTDGWRECLNCRTEFDPATYTDRVRQNLAELHAAA
ncbi:hypothetical protein ACFYS8_13355 [Kitasatospora sp. NPDC004615]|uniref:hypothetical protein n=1 Tax=Kitasatospora sp. NPDC004615 TaxID=3364017 RepID=UPI0036B80690